MTPGAVAKAIFQACADENWEEFLKYYTRPEADEDWLEMMGGLEIIRIGEPFKSKDYSGWFVPYEVKLKSGRIMKHNLAVRNDNEEAIWLYDGGLP